MAWYDEAVFYHIYPLGLTGAPKTNSYGEPEHRLNTLLPWIGHMREIGCSALYIGPLFESVGHGYETTDYKKLDSRLGTNEDLAAFVEECHGQGIRVILDGVFNHTGRDFFAFQDIKKNRENSQYKDWYCRVNFWGNNEYNDGFSYENWGGYDLLAKLNQNNPAVRDYICDVIRFWAREFKIDGIRLDAADVLDFGYMHALRQTAQEIGTDFWLMGEVIHGDYTRWVNEGTLHSVTNYSLHKALYSGHNDHNYFEIAHTVKRLYEMGGNRPDGLKLYNFVDNHDVERIYTKLNNKAHFVPVHILLYTLPGVPSIYYGSEFGIEGKKERYSDASLRPALSLEDYRDVMEKNSCVRLIAALGKTRQKVKALSYGDYKELILTNRQYGFARNYDGESVIVAVNNDDNEAVMNFPAGGALVYRDMLSGETAEASDGRVSVKVPANSGGIWVPADRYEEDGTPVLGDGLRGRSDAEKAVEKPEAPAGQSSAGKSAGKPGAPESRESGDASEAEKTGSGGRAVEPEKAGNGGGGRAVEPEKAGSGGSGRAVEPEKAGSGGSGRAVEPEKAGNGGGGRAVEPEKAGSCESGGAGGAVKPESGGSTMEPDVAAGRDNGGVGKPGAPDREKAAAEQNPKTEPAGRDAGEEAEASDACEPEAEKKPAPVSRKKTYEEMTIGELQQAILDRMAKNGPITDRMRQDVMENVYHNSLINWIKSFR